MDGWPCVRRDCAIIWDGTKVILFGGWQYSSVYSQDFKNDLWWYVPASNTWIKEIPENSDGSPPARSYHSMIWDGTKIIMFGGYGFYGYYNDLWWYNP
ncbi:MAG: kelch repeat-containing protein [Planctomycetota bacterium]